MRCFVVICFGVALAVVVSTAHIPRALVADRTRTSAGAPRPKSTTEVSVTRLADEVGRTTNIDVDTYMFGDDIKLKRDVALRLQRYAQITSQRVSEDILYICRELCQ